MLRSLKSFVKNFGNFSGRSSRTEFWWPWLLNGAVWCVLYIVVLVDVFEKDVTPKLLGLFILYSGVVFIPSLSLCVRRLHDCGLSGWCMLLLPILSIYGILILGCIRSNAGTNKYGANPRDDGCEKQLQKNGRKVRATVPKDPQTRNSVETAQTEEQYTYCVGSISSTDPWIVITCNEEDATWDYMPFAYLVKKAARAMNDGIWEGNIVPAGDTRFRIKNDPLLMVFQYDSLFGIVIEYAQGIGVSRTLDYLSSVLDITVDEKFR